jgi:phosphohistidine phosphatase SixA
MHLLTALTFATLLAAPQPVHEQLVAQLRGEELVHALQSGGYTILVRHARTDRNAPSKETPGTAPPLRADQRNLTADGERDVALMRDVVEKYHLPIGEVISSPSYRCRETADAFGPSTVTMTLRAFPTTAETQALVAAAPKPGTNRVLVTHHFVIENHVPGIAPGDIDE